MVTRIKKKNKVAILISDKADTKSKNMNDHFITV